MSKSVIVGIDGSPPSTRAADVAGGLAMRHGLPLRLMHVFSWPALYPPFLPESVAVQVNPRALSRQIVASASATIAELYPALTIDTRLVDGDAAGVLVQASRHAAFLVVGHRGLGGFTELLLGSVGVHTTTHAHCPVLVVRGEPGPPQAPVVVGVDGSPPSRVAARVAFEEARSRGTELVAVLAWPPTRSWSAAIAAAGLPAHPAGIDPVAVSLGAIAEEYPDVTVRRELRHGDSPPHVLATVASAVGAGLIVVGSRGFGGFHGLLIGGTSRTLVDHSPCPVMVVPKDPGPSGTNGRRPR